MDKVFRFPLAACWLTAAALLGLSSSAVAIEYTFRKVFDSTGQFTHVYAPSLNDRGAMVFTALVNSDGGGTTAGNYALTEVGEFVTIADPSGGYYVDVFSPPSINNSNTVAFLAATVDYPFVGIYRRFSFGAPEIFTQISDNPGGNEGLGTPWISNSNAVAYVAQVRPSDEIPGGLVSLMSGSIPLDTGPPETTFFFNPDINSTDSVVATGFVDGVWGIYLNARGSVYIGYQDTASINDDATIAFKTQQYGPLGIYTGDGFSTPTLYVAGDLIHSPDINNSGLVAYMDNISVNDGTQMIFVGTGREPLLSDRELFGSQVSGVEFYRGLNNRGQIAFSYRLANGEHGIALASPRVPTMLGNGDFNNGLGLFEVIGNGYGSTRNVDGDPRLEMSTGNGVLSVRQGMANTDQPYLLEFDFDWLTPAGSLDVVVNDVLALSIGADRSILSGVGTPVVQLLDDLTRLSLQFTPADMDDPLAGYIRFDLHPGSEATIQIDNITFAPVPTTTTGDYNQNGIVDTADYVVWRDRLGSLTSLPNDDTPGVDLDDYDRWKENYGQIAGAGSIAFDNTTVPEPSTLVLLMSAVAGCRFRRGRAA